MSYQRISQDAIPKGDGSVCFKVGELVQVSDVVTGRWRLARINLGFRRANGRVYVVVRLLGYSGPNPCRVEDLRDVKKISPLDAKRLLDMRK